MMMMMGDTNATSISSTTTSSNNNSGLKNNKKRILVVDDEPDVIIVFKMVLEMNGFELYKKLRTIDDKVKVCFITAYEDYRKEFKESFPELDETKYFIRKPTAIEDLVNHVSAILG
jgi:two-component SAPR family response regulator